MKTMMTVVLAALLSGPALAGAPMSETAERVSAAARRAGVARVAVLPLEGRDGASSRDGALLADALIGEVVRAARVRVVERMRLPAVMSERSLGDAAGAAADDGGRRLASADAVVTGTCSRRGGRMRASVRLVHAETGEILAAVEETFDWDAPAREPREREEASFAAIVVPPPPFTVAVPDLGDEPLELRDAPNDGPCEDAGRKVDAVESGVLELKARYWASELRKGFSPLTAARGPGADISDPALKERFYQAVGAWSRRGFIPELSRAELERMRREDARAAALSARCGV